MVAVAVPFAELALASAWFFSINRSRVVPGTAALLLAFAVVSGLRAVGDGHAPCGCLGALERTRFGRAIAGDAAARSTIMFAACVQWLVFRRGRGRSENREKR